MGVCHYDDDNDDNHDDDNDDDDNDDDNDNDNNDDNGYAAQVDGAQKQLVGSLGAIERMLGIITEKLQVRTWIMVFELEKELYILTIAAD